MKSLNVIGVYKNFNLLLFERQHVCVYSFNFKIMIPKHRYLFYYSCDFFTKGMLIFLVGSLGGDIPSVLRKVLDELDEMIHIENQRIRDSTRGIKVGTTLKGIELISSLNNDEDNQHHENGIESKELEDAVKQSRERVEEEQQILGKAPPFGISSMPISQVISFLV